MSRPAAEGAEAVVAARNALSLGTSLAVTGSLALLVRVMIPRYLGPDAFGEYRLAETAAELLFVLLTLGVDIQLRQEAAVSPARARGYMLGLAVLRIAIGAAGVAAIAAFLGLTGASRATLVLFVLIAAAQILLVLNNTYAAFEQAAGDVRWIARNNIGMKILWAAVLGAILVVWPAGVTVAAAALAVEAVRFAWLTGRGLRQHHVAARPDVRLAVSAVAASLPFFVNVVAHSVYARIGTGWLAAVATDTELAYYGAASNLASVALLGMPLVTWVLVPSAARAASASADEMVRLVSSALRTSLLLIVPVTLAFFVAPGFWATAFFGPAYVDAAPVLRILAPTFATAYASTVCAIAVIQRGRVWTVTGISLAGVAAAVPLHMVLVPWGMAHFGAAGGSQGAALATLAVETLATVALCWTSRDALRAPALIRTAWAITAGALVAVVVARVGPQVGVLPSVLAVATFMATVVLARGVDLRDLQFCRSVVGRGRSSSTLTMQVEAA